MLQKIFIHLWTLPRWFAAPFFAVPVLLGVILAGGSLTSLNAWLILISVMCSMASGHAMNSYLDYLWTGLDKGEKEDRSAEKYYTGGQNIIENGKVSTKAILFNALIWQLISLSFVFVVVLRIGIHLPGLSLIWLWIAGVIVPFWYSKAKFNWTHELALGVGCGLLPTLMGMFAVSSNPPIWHGVLVSLIPAAVLSFAGLALDEWPDAEANLKKGVKSLAYKVWEVSEWTSPKLPGNLTISGIELEKSLSLLQWYVSVWLLMVFGLHIFLITAGILAPLSGLGFLMFPPILCSMVFLKKHFDRTAVVIIALAAFYLILILIGQVVG